MSDQETVAKLRQLPVDERLQLLEDVWLSLADAPDELEIPGWHRKILDARLAVHGADVGAPRPWSDVKAEILDSLGK